MSKVALYVSLGLLVSLTGCSVVAVSCARVVKAASTPAPKPTPKPAPTAAEIAKAKAQAKKEGVSIGMTREEVLGSCWGRPRKINRTINAYVEHEQWVYGHSGKNYLYFDNGILTSIQN